MAAAAANAAAAATAAAVTAVGGQKPSSASDAALFSFGVVADIQYADKDNGGLEGRMRRYREGPAKLKAAIADFNKAEKNVSFVLTLGDIIDGNETEEKTKQDFDVVLKTLEELAVPHIFHTLGNHCLCLPRPLLFVSLGMPAAYYHRRVHAQWHLLVLDSMDVSSRSLPNSPQLEEAELLREQFPEDEWPQMRSYNGAVGRGQKAWLKDMLAWIESCQQHAIVAIHHPIALDSVPPKLLLWNYQEISDLCCSSPAVAAVLSGHHHPGGYAEQEGTHFVTLEAILEAPSDSLAHAIINVFDDRLEIDGVGVVTSRVLKLKSGGHDNKDDIAKQESPSSATNLATDSLQNLKLSN